MSDPMDAFSRMFGTQSGMNVNFPDPPLNVNEGMSYSDPYAPPVSLSQYSGTGDANDMKKILTKMYGSAGSGILRENNNPQYHNNDYLPEPTYNNGYQENNYSSNPDVKGEWEIVVKENTSGKTYVIKHNLSNDIIAKDICLYETASALINVLASRNGLRNSKIIKLLELDFQYARLRSNAVQEGISYKRALKENIKSKIDITLSRYDNSKRETNNIRNKILDLVKTINQI